MQASAACPKCGNVVWSDRLAFEDYVVIADGSEKPRRLVIACETCGKTSTIRLAV